MGIKSLRPSNSNIPRKGRIGPLLSLALIIFLAYNLLLSLFGSSSSARKETQSQTQPAHLGQPLSHQKSRLARWNSHSLISLDSWSWARQTALVYILLPDSSVSGSAHYEKRGANSHESTTNLKYALRSLETYMPWHEGPVYVISPPGHEPTWLNQTHPRLNWLSHESLLPQEDLPNWNHNAVEQFLHYIPGITETFMVLDPNQYLSSVTKPADFFMPKGGIRLFLDSQGEKLPPTPSQAEAIAEIKRIYDWSESDSLRVHAKAPRIYHTGAFQEMHKRFNEPLRRTANHHKPNKRDVSVAMLHHAFVINEGYDRLGLQSEVTYPEFEMVTGCNADEEDERAPTKDELDDRVDSPVDAALADQLVQPASASDHLTQFELDTIFNVPSSFENGLQTGSGDSIY